MAGVAVVTDSTASLTPDVAAGAGVVVVPLSVVIDGVSRLETAEDVDGSTVAAALRAGRKVSTSRPTTEAFAAVYHDLAGRGHEAVVSVHLSREISGTVDAAEVAAASAGVPVSVVDSRTVAMALGFAVLSGAEAARTGAGAAEVAALARSRAAASTTYFCVDSLEYLRRGGRIGAAQALLGSALAVKPLLTVSGGRIQPYERVRTTAKALARLEELAMGALAVAAGTGCEADVAVHHLDDLERAERLMERLAGRVSAPGTVSVAEVSAVLGVHVGPRTLGVVVSRRPV